jgi:hypothetical protein
LRFPLGRLDVSVKTGLVGFPALAGKPCAPQPLYRLLCSNEHALAADGVDKALGFQHVDGLPRGQSGRAVVLD